MSAFRILYESNNDQRMITVTGFDHSSFTIIHNLFKDAYDAHTPYTTSGHIERLSVSERRSGRPRTLDSIGGLGLTLAWFRTRGSMTRSLSWTFWITGTVTSVFVHYGRWILLHVLQKNPLARISMPTNENIF